jgi:hypothetical protein
MQTSENKVSTGAQLFQETTKELTNTLVQHKQQGQERLSRTDPTGG